MKVKAGRKRTNKNKKKKSSDILKLHNKENDYHEKKNNENNLEIKDQLDMQAYKAKLKEIYDLIKEGKYEKKPVDIYINNINNELIDEKEKDILNKISSITKYNLISDIELLYKFNYEKINKTSNELDKCSICQYNFFEDENKEGKSVNDELPDFEELFKKKLNVILLKNCHDHFFHIECLDLLIGDKKSFKCPNCSKIYGILIGDQPPGSMSAHISYNFHCSGFEDCDTIVIKYDFPSGSEYSGTYRTAFLPNNKEGKEILGLLKVCFDRKLTFTVGTSVTTGVTNTTVWNGVHHKTNLYGGSTNFGYPDNTYFNRVKQELAAKGVVQDNIDEDVIKIAEDLLNNNNDYNYY